MKYPILTFVSVIIFPTLLHAESAASTEERDQLTALLQEQTAIATRTRMNADYVPGMVTVLHGDDLEARGARTVWEGLALVPGIETAIEKTGRRKVLVRGLGNTWASGNVKVLLNDVSMNSAELGLAEPIFNIPVEQVERIEVIRGPGSAIYGEYAYMGVINVVTRSDRSRAYAFGGSFNTAGVGGTLLFSSPEDPLQASINVAGWRSSGADVKTGQDVLYTFGEGNTSYAPGRANEDVDAATGVVKLGYHGFSLTAQSSQDGIGDHFGINYILPPNHNRIVERTRHRAVDARQELTLASGLTAGIRLGWKDFARTRNDLFVINNPDIYLASNHHESTTTFGADLTYRGWERHIVFVEASASRTRVDESWITFSQPIGSAITIAPGTTRNISAITLQDEFRQSDLFTLTTGLRYDSYSDDGSNVSPRIAGVWRLNERNIVKAQYARAFRPPTLFELASAIYWKQPAMAAARISTSELGYIYKGESTETKLTAFYSQLDDLVVFAANQSNNTQTFGSEGAISQGVEMEQSWRASQQWLLEGNLSFVQTKDKLSGKPFPGTAQWIGNLSSTYEYDRFSGTAQFHYVSGYFREQGDTRPTLAGYTTVNLTGTVEHFLWRQMKWRVGVKNLFDTKVRYPAPIVAAGFPAYADDYPQAGRSWWTQLSYLY